MKKKIILALLFFFISCSKKESVNIYKTNQYLNLNEKDKIIGESVWATSCFRCHMYGSNGANALDDKEYWDKTAEKGLEDLFKSVWEGKYGEEGAMPPKGLCPSCSEDQIEKSILYLFKITELNESADSL